MAVTRGGFLAAAAAALFCTTGAGAHSWMECTDYDAATDECRGRPRYWLNVTPGFVFGRDWGRDRRPGRAFEEGGGACSPLESRADPLSSAYDETYPMATWRAGQPVTILWPAKGHATVPNPDRGVQIYLSWDDFSEDMMVADMGFSNCVPRLPGVDSAKCTGNFTVSENLSDGVYGVMWFWEFHSGEYYNYNSCADVRIKGDRVAAAARRRVLRHRAPRAAREAPVHPSTQILPAWLLVVVPSIVPSIALSMAPSSIIGDTGEMGQHNDSLQGGSQESLSTSNGGMSTPSMSPTAGGTGAGLAATTATEFTTTAILLLAACLLVVTGLFAAYVARYPPTFTRKAQIYSNTNDGNHSIS